MIYILHMIKKMLWIIYSIQRKRYKSILNLKYRQNTGETGRKRLSFTAKMLRINSGKTPNKSADKQRINSEKRQRTGDGKY